MSFAMCDKNLAYQDNLSAIGNYLYSFIKDRISLSIKNGESWKDDRGYYCFFTRSEIAKLLKCSLPTARKVVKELVTVGLIVDIRQGLTKPNKIYLKDGQSFVRQLKEKFSHSKEQDNCDKESKEFSCNNTDTNDTNYSNNNNNKEDENSSAPTVDEIKEQSKANFNKFEEKSKANKVANHFRERKEIQEIFTELWFELFKRNIALSESEISMLLGLCHRVGTSYVVDVMRTKVNTNNWLRINITPYHLVKHFEDICNGTKYAQ